MIARLISWLALWAAIIGLLFLVAGFWGLVAGLALFIFINVVGASGV